MKLQFTKNSLRSEEVRLKQLERYLPTLKLKKMLLQSEVDNSSQMQMKLQEELKKAHQEASGTVLLLSKKYEEVPVHFAQVKHVQKRYENIAGLEVPVFEKVIFEEDSYSLYATPIWFDSVLTTLKDLTAAHQKIIVEEEKKRALQKELREVSIRVNLFEKVLIPKAKDNIKKIKIFLDDTQLSALAQAKVAKEKILKKKAYADQA